MAAKGGFSELLQQLQQHDINELLKNPTALIALLSGIVIVLLLLKSVTSGAKVEDSGKGAPGRIREPAAAAHPV